ncbi:MAG: FAD:protein FMN transferase [Pseudobdellovibrio sp.]
MTSSKKIFKRMRPLLGTFVEITLYGDADLHPVITSAFEKAEQLAKIFNYHDPQSELSLYNLASDKRKKLSPELSFLIEKAIELRQISDGAFTPFRQNTEKLDLSGLAKGYIVDQVVETVSTIEVNIEGVVNAGGDLRQFNTDNRTIGIRLASNRIHQLDLVHEAVASSSLFVAKTDKNSSTIYGKELRTGLNCEDTVVILAGKCLWADALTKIALFAPLEIRNKCAIKYKAQIFVFDENGNLKEMFNGCENQ